MNERGAISLSGDISTPPRSVRAVAVHTVTSVWRVAGA